MSGLIVDDLVIQAEGAVLSPPSFAELMERLRDYAERKQPVNLSPGEVRVLVDGIGE